MPIEAKLTQQYKSLPEGMEIMFPDFCLLTGKNGSGKSHILEAMNQNIVKASGKILNRKALIPFNGLSPQITEQCQPNHLATISRATWAKLNESIGPYRRLGRAHQSTEEMITQYLNIEEGVDLPRNKLIRDITEATGKHFTEITEPDVHEYMSFTSETGRSLFQSQIAVIFQAYHARQHKNQFREYRASKGEAIEYLQEDEFLKRFGPAPWDVLNEILAKSQLPYRFEKPKLDNLDVGFELRLINPLTQQCISPSELSTGEKVLMSLALAIYNTSEEAEKPDLLLLDEPDAALHPSYSKLLIEIIVEIIVIRADIKVVMTTHSPATVALAPANCIYQVDRIKKTPELVSNLVAIANLTEGLEFFRVGYENRRQIFVESNYDAQYYDKIFQILNRKNSYKYQPFFMNPHREKNTNSSDVKTIIDQLISSGCDTAWGIIDHDNINSRSNKILVIGDGNRYAIENYILDPLYIALSLIRERALSFSDFGINNKSRYPEASQLTRDECQQLIDNFLSIIGIALKDLAPATLINGFIVYYPREFLYHQGHSYESLIKSRIPKLNALSKGKGDSGLKLAIIETIADFPLFLPMEIESIFNQIN